MDVDSTEQNQSKATFDPGWNDPPTFSYDSTKAAAQPGKRGTLLNKRVAFPMGPSSGTPIQSPSGAGDPPSVRPPAGPPSDTTSPSLPGPSSTLANSVSGGTASCQEAIEKGVDVLRQLVGTLPADDKREKEDIRKRLDVLRKMCKEDKLNADIYSRLVHLASSLQNGDTTTASNIQAGLMVDHVSLCSSWMAGVRLLVRRIADPDS